MSVKLEDQIKAVKREIAMRDRVYPRWVSQRKLTQAAADRELAAMRAVLATLEELAARQVPPLFALNGG